MEFVLQVEPRTALGRAENRRMRRGGERVPGIVYGADRPPRAVSVAHNELAKLMQDERFFSHVVKIRQADGVEQDVVLRELQRHPVHSEQVLHLDFLRVSADTPIRVRVPLHFINEIHCLGVKAHGGRISRSVTDIEVSCLPHKIPDFIEVDMLNVDVKQSLHLSDLQMPEMVAVVALSYGPDHDLPVASVKPPRGGMGAADKDEEQEGEED